LILAFGAAYATGKSAEGIGIAWVKRRRLGMRALVPIVMAGIIGIYGLVVAVVIIGKIERDYTVYQFVLKHGFQN
jgi:V-type H+-transporting ATPase proteolipid subunit